MSLHHTCIYGDTAHYYTRYREDYPQDMIDNIMHEVGKKKFNRMLDMGCGTGKSAFAFHKHFKEIIAVDIDEKMIQEAVRISKKKKIKNITWITNPGEAVDVSYGKFDLITFGASLHRMDIKKVLPICFDLLDKGGIIVVLGFGRGFIKGRSEMETIVLETINKRVDKKKEKQQNKQCKGFTSEKMKVEFKKLPFSYIDFQKEKPRYIQKDNIDIDSIIGYLYSTSYCNPALLGKNIGKFEQNLKDRLYKINPKGKFQSQIFGNFTIARK